ncbi:hypothetical protein V5799_017942 [Amblyomma americanum]|uniref:Uncharacterized protein n=1 Tax=Amblyomma americanum TaxID=6943 RepID=A0AAQ4F1B1_AMBAM
MKNFLEGSGMFGWKKSFSPRTPVSKLRGLSGSRQSIKVIWLEPFATFSSVSEGSLVKLIVWLAADLQQTGHKFGCYYRYADDTSVAQSLIDCRILEAYIAAQRTLWSPRDGSLVMVLSCCPEHHPGLGGRISMEAKC